jgi:hypothetical protein
VYIMSAQGMIRIIQFEYFPLPPVQKNSDLGIGICSSCMGRQIV